MQGQSDAQLRLITGPRNAEEEGRFCRAQGKALGRASAVKVRSQGTEARSSESKRGTGARETHSFLSSEMVRSERPAHLSVFH